MICYYKHALWESHRLLRFAQTRSLSSKLRNFHCTGDVFGMACRRGTPPSHVFVHRFRRPRWKHVEGGVFYVSVSALWSNLRNHTLLCRRDVLLSSLWQAVRHRCSTPCQACSTPTSFPKTSNRLALSSSSTLRTILEARDFGLPIYDHNGAIPDFFLYKLGN